MSRPMLNYRAQSKWDELGFLGLPQIQPSDCIVLELVLSPPARVNSDLYDTGSG